MCYFTTTGTIELEDSNHNITQRTEMNKPDTIGTLKHSHIFIYAYIYMCVFVYMQYIIYYNIHIMLWCIDKYNYSELVKLLYNIKGKRNVKCSVLNITYYIHID